MSTFRMVPCIFLRFAYRDDKDILLQVRLFYCVEFWRILHNMDKPLVICTTLLIERSPQALPLGAACIASALKHDPLTAGVCDVRLIPFCAEDPDFRAHDATPEEAGAFIARSLIPDRSQRLVIVLFSVFVWNRPVLEAAAHILREQGVICIAGGPEVTAVPESFTDFDYTVSGEGELSVPHLVAELLGADGALKADSTSSADGASPADNASSTTSPETTLKTVRHIPRTPCMDLSALSSPYLDGTLDPEDYDGALWELARGCPFKCSYCFESKGEKTVRAFPMERIEAELDLFAKKKVPQVFVLDPTYNANKDRALRLLDLIAKKTPDTFYYFEARAEFIDAKLAKAFRRIPCALQIGLQSADENVLKLVNRPFNRKQFARSMSILNETGVTFGLDLIYGLPSETYKGFKAGVDFAISQYPNNLEIFCLSVLPGTDLYERADELMLTYEKKPPYHIIHTDKMSEADIARARALASACSIFYNDGCAVPWFNIVLDTLKMRASDFFERFAAWRAGALKADEVLSAGAASERSGADESAPASGSAAAHESAPSPESSTVSKSSCGQLTQRDIEALQLVFVTDLLKEKHADRFIRIVTDLIHFSGAVARNTATGAHEKVHLSYPAEYLESEWMFNLDYFVKSVKPEADTVTI